MKLAVQSRFSTVVGGRIQCSKGGQFTECEEKRGDQQAVVRRNFGPVTAIIVLAEESIDNQGASRDLRGQAGEKSRKSNFFTP